MRARAPLPIAICYDFDGTLSPGNMQEFDFVPAIGMSRRRFWQEVDDLAQRQQADRILAYMSLMLRKARDRDVPVRRSDFVNFGRSVTLFPGVKEWFTRINRYGAGRGARVEHFIISSGIREMILGTPIAKWFSAIFASSFMYDRHEVAYFPALAINYTTKTQYLFRINKGNLKVYDDSRINEYIPKPQRSVPFENMIFIGDGDTDVPCFRLIRDQGGHAIAVYRPNARGAKAKAEKLIGQQRVDFVCPADYRGKGRIEQTVHSIIDKVVADARLGGSRKA
jgi:phosphoserine phosphatase